jgi:hypothetical protein
LFIKESIEEKMIGSWLGQVFCIDYVLKVFVEYDTWNKFGSEGEVCSIPIIILQRPFPGQESIEPFRVPIEWNPIVGTVEPTYIYQEENKVSVYFN